MYLFDYCIFPFRHKPQPILSMGLSNPKSDRNQLTIVMIASRSGLYVPRVIFYSPFGKQYDLQPTHEMYTRQCTSSLTLSSVTNSSYPRLHSLLEAVSAPLPSLCRASQKNSSYPRWHSPLEAPKGMLLANPRAPCLAGTV